MPSAHACPPVEEKKGPKRVLLRVGGVLPPGVQRNPKTPPEIAADPEYQEGLRKS